MGSWDCYCAICAGPMGGAYIREQAHARASGDTQVEDDDGKSFKSTCNSEKDEENSDEEDEENWEDEGDGDQLGYDPNVLQHEDLNWTTNCRVLGVNGNCTRVNKAFISGPGHYDDYGGMSCGEGDDPNCEGFGVEGMSCYHDYNKEDPVFPFHMDCFKLLCRYLTGSDDIHAIDKDIMYDVLRSLSRRYWSRLGLDYNEPGTDIAIPNEQYWECNPGEEFYVVSPLRMAPLSAADTEKLQRGTNLASLNPSLATKVKSDPFSNLPPEVTDQFIFNLDHRSLMNLFKASWALHSTHHNNHDFWMKQIRDRMESFFEVHEFLQSPINAGDIASSKAIYLWAQLKSKPRNGRKGRHMGVANRRRIWHVCGQIAQGYRAKISSTTTVMDEFIQDNTSSPYTCIISWPLAASDQTLVQPFWIPSWDDLYCPKRVETFWDSEGYLTGIAVTINGQKRLLGFDSEQHDVKMRSLELQKHDWITGIILHIPKIDPLAPPVGSFYPKPPNTFTSPKGVVIRTSSGAELLVGETDAGHCQRPLLAPRGQTVVGVTGHIGLTKGKPRIMRLGLLLCPRSLPIASVQAEVSKPPLKEKFLWADSACQIQGRPIWDHAHLNLRIYEGGLASQPGGSYFNDEIVPHEAFLWAHNSDQLWALKRLTIYNIKSGTAETDGPVRSLEISKGVCNMRADFDTSSGLGPVFARAAEANGKPIPDDDYEVFDIDGPGGERIIELSALMGLYLDAFKLRTNRGREFMWKVRSKVGGQWKSLTVAEGDAALAGLVLAFSDPCGYDPVTTVHSRDFSRLDYLAVVTTKHEG